MRIGFYTNCYKPRINGVVRSISIFRRALAELGHEVYLFAPDAPGFTDSEPHVHRYPAIPIENGALYRPAIPCSRAMSRIASTVGLQIMHTHHPAGLGWAAWYQARRLDVPLVYTLHSQYHLYCTQYPLVGRVLPVVLGWFVLSYMRRCQRVILPTKPMYDRVVRDVPDLEPRLVVVSTPLYPQAFVLQKPHSVAAARRLREALGLKEHFVFAVASRLSAEKGLSDLLEAFAMLERRRKGVRLLIVGDGPVRETLEQQAADLDVGHAVIFTGMVPFEQMPLHLAAADAFAYASQVDTQALVLGEAMAAGLPVVAYDAPFTREIIEDDKNGLLAEPNPRALSRKMQLLVDHPDLHAHLAEAAVRTAQRYEPHAIAARLADIYEEAIDEHRREKRAAHKG